MNLIEYTYPSKGGRWLGLDYYGIGKFAITSYYCACLSDELHELN